MAEDVLPVQPPSVLQLEAAAERFETPCGPGSIVWHAWGPTTGEPLVLLHGGSGSFTHWLKNIPVFAAAGRRVWVPDLPGFGDSAPPPDGDDADAMPAPLEAGLAALIGDQPVDLVGFSFGGMVAGFWAAASPARVRRLVIVGAPALGVVEKRSVALRGWRHLPEGPQRDAIHRHNLGVLMLHDPEAISDEALAVHRANVVRDRLQRRKLAFTSLLAQALGKIRCPVDAIYGEHDSIYLERHEALQEALRAAAPTLGQLVWIADAGHWVQWEQAQAFDSALARLLGIEGVAS